VQYLRKQPSGQDPDQFRNQQRPEPCPELWQLKLKREDFALSPQLGSKIEFASKTLRFTNELSTLENEIREKFPDEYENFLKLKEYIVKYNEVDLSHKFTPSREIIGRYIGSELLVDMLLCPLMYYGSAYEEDMDFSQFVIMFKSIYMEGFSRPKDGVKFIIDKLVKKFESQGGEIRFRSRVSNILIDGEEAVGVTLENGEKYFADRIFSSAGICETEELVGENVKHKSREGQLSFVELIFVLDLPPKELGFEDTIIFFNDTDRFEYKKPEKLVDYRSGVLCCPNNFDYSEPMSEGMIRFTHMANYEFWKELSKEEYVLQKEDVIKKSIKRMEKYIPGFGKHVVFTDMFTPLTVRKYTGHLNGAVYGSPDKSRDGRTGYKNLYLIGTDQGFLGIIGSMLSGISIANLYGLMGGKL